MVPAFLPCPLSKRSFTWAWCLIGGGKDTCLCFQLQGSLEKVFRALPLEPELMGQDFLQTQERLSVGAVQPENVNNVRYRQTLIILLPNYIFTSPNLTYMLLFQMPIEWTLEQFGASPKFSVYRCTKDLGFTIEWKKIRIQKNFSASQIPKMLSPQAKCRGLGQTVGQSS